MTKTERQHEILLFERLVDMIERMGATERQALRAWENTNLGGDSPLGTADWPGWNTLAERLSH